ncbi:helix-turn-helix domain-containing protein [Kitasatospora sp. LaBMicrA B282]|uniref:helix-turn-helix domain-containing protein n=1 Tax=Kitasatospora sp. LaBMicrA B282 TaxID=3420949 RepID=UPI003D10ECF6
MAGQGRGGGPWGPIRADTDEARALALFLRRQVESSGLTMVELARRIPMSRTQADRYLAGRVPDQSFVTALVAATVSEPRLRERRQAEAVQLLRAARSPVPVGRTVPAGEQFTLVEPARVRSHQAEVYDRLTGSLEQHGELQRTANNSARLVLVLLQVLQGLEQRVQELSAEHARLRDAAGEPQPLARAERLLARALDQERRAREELHRAQEKQRQAEDLAAGAQEQLRTLTDELYRLRAGQRGTDDESRSVPGTSYTGHEPADQVGDAIEQALTRATAVNDAEDQTLRRITDELREGRHAPRPEAEPGGDLVGPFEGPRAVPEDPDDPDDAAASAVAQARLDHLLDLAGMGAAVEGYWQVTAGLYAALTQSRARLLGADDRQTLIARGFHACSVGLAGDATRAADLLETLVTDSIRVLGPDDRATLIARSFHAYWRERR